MQDILWLRSCIELDSFLLEAKVGLWRSKYDATPEFRFKNYDGRMCEKTTFQTVQFYCKNIHPTLNSWNNKSTDIKVNELFVIPGE